MPRSGFAGAMTLTPFACSRSITPFQLDASANAPWTSTTVTVSVLGGSAMRSFLRGRRDAASVWATAQAKKSISSWLTRSASS